MCARAHSLRGSASAIGAEELGLAADMLERAVLQKKIPAKGEVEALRLALDVVVAGLGKYFSTQLDSRQHTAPDLDGTLAVRAQLDVMLSEFSGDAIDYFDQSRGQLAAVLPPAALLLEGHRERYEFDSARALLAAHLHVTS